MNESPEWQPFCAYMVGAIVSWKGDLYRCAEAGTAGDVGPVVVGESPDGLRGARNGSLRTRHRDNDGVGIRVTAASRRVMLTKEQRADMRRENEQFIQPANAGDPKWGEYGEPYIRVRERKIRVLLDALDEMERERDELRDVLRSLGIRHRNADGTKRTADEMWAELKARAIDKRGDEGEFVDRAIQMIDRHHADK